MLKNSIHYKNINKIISAIEKHHGKARVVGGCVRDFLLNQETQDIDLATDLLPDDTEKALHAAAIKSIPTGKNYGTISAIINKHTYEITTLRKDVETDGRRAVVEYTDDWQEDSSRRDFTINAMSYDLIEDNLYDYYNGKADLEHGIVRFVGEAEKRVQEDYLRILRYFRFHGSLGKKVDQDSLSACKKYLHNISSLSGERILMELKKISFTQSWFKTLNFMQKNKILDEIFGITKTNYFIILEKIHEHNLNHHLDLLLYILSNGNYSIIASKLKLSNKQTSYMRKLDKCLSAENSLLEHPKKYIYLYENKVYFDALQIHCLMLGNIEPYRRIHSMLEDYIVSSFPLSGDDVKKHFNVSEGKEVGLMLKKAEGVWLAADMKIDKKSLLEKLKTEHIL